MGFETNLKVMVVDDTVIFRKVMSEVVASIDGVELSTTAPNGRIALTKLAGHPTDVVLLDVEMPEMNGLDALREIRKNHPDVNVIMVSGTGRSSADTTIEALENGALDFVPKPEGADAEESHRQLVATIKPLLASCAVRRNLRPRHDLHEESLAPKRIDSEPAIAVEPPPAAPPLEIKKAPIPRTIDVVVIGVSTGGPESLVEVIPKLPEDLGVPVLMVQHMPPVFTASLAAGLNKKSRISVSEGTDGEPIQPSKVYIAPGGRHMVVRSSDAGENRVRFVGLNETPPVNSCRPSVDVLLRSVANVYQGNILSIIMTGMGEDGMDGVRVAKRKGCYSITQSKETCVIYGMPRAVEERRLSDEVVPLDRIAKRIAEIVKG